MPNGREGTPDGDTIAVTLKHSHSIVHQKSHRGLLVEQSGIAENGIVHALDDFLTKSQKEARPAGFAMSVLEFKEKESVEEYGPMYGTTFTLRGKVVPIPEEGGTLYFGTQSCRVLNSGSVLYGPPPMFPSR